ncbi:MAG: fibronectin type III domain-containing protein, partial [Acidobacteriaceae bacterium]
MAVFVSSTQAQWAALPLSPPASSSATSEGYELDASTASDFSGTLFSSATVNVRNSTLAVSGLSPNSTYYFRADSLNWDHVQNYLTLGDTNTLAAVPSVIAPAYAMVGITSATVQWGADLNPADTLYTLNLSTALNFTGTLFSSNTLNTSATLTGLNPNTTYYAEVNAQNNTGAATAFVALGSTITQASQPQAPAYAFNPVFVTSLTVSFNNGSPANPTGTLYDVELSTDPAFSVYTASLTANLSAAFTGLSINTTYYAQAAAQNSNGYLSPFSSLASTSTLAVPPGTSAPTYSGLSATGFTLSWSSGDPSYGYNPDGTAYDAIISTSSGFTGSIIEQIVASTQTSFGGLVAGTVYHAEVAAINNGGLETTFTSYGSTQTLNSSAPSFLNGSFLISNASGVFQNPSLYPYTDTTTPSLQIQAQSNFSPGLSVTNTPSQLALWHLDEGSGSTSQDSSTHGQTLTLYGSPTPSWTSGILGDALKFDGTQSYAASPDFSLVPFRDSATDNQWTVSLWFNSSLAHGYLCQWADSNAPGGAGQNDGDISWYKSTGRLTLDIYNAASGRYIYIQAPKSYADGKWHFASAQLSPSGMALYVDGQLAVSGTGANSTNALTYPGPTYLWLGAASIATSNMGGSTSALYFPGTIDEVLISTVALTQAQVQQQYSLVLNQTHEMGAPNLDISTQAGANNTWNRLPTTASTITGTNGTTAAQTWTSTISLSNLSLVQSTAPNAPTNQVMFLASSLDSNETTTQFTILVDTTPPLIPSFSSLSNPTTYGLTLNGLYSSDALSGLPSSPFLLQASTDPSFGIINANSGFITGPNFGFTSLWPNTTYYFRAQAQDAAGNISSFSSSQSLATLAVFPSTRTIPFISVGFSSATLAWNALPASPPAPSSASAQGYQLDASTTNFGALSPGGIIVSSISFNLNDSTLTLNGLDSNTTYYFRVGDINPAGLISYSDSGSTSTLALPLGINPPSITAVYGSSISAQWTPLNLSPSSMTAESYLLEASSTNFSAASPGGIIYSSSTANAAVSSLSLLALWANTTYYLRVSALDWNDAPNQIILGSTPTLANAPAPANPTFLSVFSSSADVQWTALPPYPSSTTSEGYELDASTAADFSGLVISSQTSNPSDSALILKPLSAQTTYYFRVESINWQDELNVTFLGSTITLASTHTLPPATVADLSASTDTASSLYLNWLAPSDPYGNPFSGKYAIQYSTATGVVWSTASANVVFSTLDVVAGSSQSYTISILDANTTYYVRLWTSDTVPNWSQPSNISTQMTLANPVTGINFPVLPSTTSIALAWTALPPYPSSTTSEGYELEASSTDFGAVSPGGAIVSSSTANNALSALSVSGLSPNTTYYFQVGSLN